MVNNIETLGVRVKTLRTDNKMSQEQLAEKIGVKRTSIYLWETNASTPTANNLHKLAIVFKCDVEWLALGEVNRHIINSLGFRARNKRLERGMAQQEIADLVGVRRASISMWESDETCPNGENLLKLAKALSVDVEFLQFGKTKQTENIYDGLSHDAVKVIEAVAKLDKNDRHKIKAMRVLLRI